MRAPLNNQIFGTELSTGVAGTAYIPSNADTGTVLETTNAAAVTITIPTVVAAVWRIGTKIDIHQYGAGIVTVQGDTGVIIRSNGSKFRTNGLYAIINLRMRAPDEWVLSGNAQV